MSQRSHPLSGLEPIRVAYRSKRLALHLGFEALNIENTVEVVDLVLQSLGE
jgi:hypothetical protein